MGLSLNFPHLAEELLVGRFFWGVVLGVLGFLVWLCLVEES